MWSTTPSIVSAVVTSPFSLNTSSWLMAGVSLVSVATTDHTGRPSVRKATADTKPGSVKVSSLSSASLILRTWVFIVMGPTNQ